MAPTQLRPLATGTQTRTRPQRRRRRLQTLLTYLVLTAGAIVFAVPFLWMLSSSLKAQTEVFVFPPEALPRVLQWQNYRDALTAVPFGLYLRNSVIVSALVVIGTILSSSLVAYGFAYIKGWGSNVLFAIVLATLMLPSQVTIIPTFLIFRQLNWVNTLLPLTVPFFFGSAFNIFLYRQFFLGIPRDILDASKIDGCNHLGSFARIVFPMSKAATATVGVLAFFWSWNEFLLPLIYLNTQDLYTVPLGLAMFQQFYAMQTPWHWLMAASVVAVLPLIVTFFLAQRVFIQGIVVTGLK